MALRAAGGGDGQQRGGRGRGGLRGPARLSSQVQSNSEFKLHKKIDTSISMGSVNSSEDFCTWPTSSLLGTYISKFYCSTWQWGEGDQCAMNVDDRLFFSPLLQEETEVKEQRGLSSRWIGRSRREKKQEQKIKKKKIFLRCLLPITPTSLPTPRKKENWSVNK